MHSMESQNPLDTHKGILWTYSWHGCGIANPENDMHDIDKNRFRATPPFKMNQNVDPVPNNSSP